MRHLLWLISLVAPREFRPRWFEEWQAEVRHGGWRMLTGALPDAWAMRRLASASRRPASGARRPFHALDQDVRYALRGFAQGRSYSLAVIVSLAVGIGATTAGFSMVNAAFFRPLPDVHAEDQLVRPTIGWGARNAYLNTTWADYEVLRDGIPALSDLSIAHPTSLAAAPQGGGEARKVPGLIVSGNYFHVLGVKPALGRFFAAEEDSAPWSHPAVVVSHRYWQRHLAGDPAAIGRTLSVNGSDLPIIGVAPAGFDLHDMPQVWVTFALSELTFRDADGNPIHVREAMAFRSRFVGRLEPGASIEQARAQAAGLAEGLQRGRDRGVRQLVVRVDSFRIDDPEIIGLQSLALMIIPIIVLVIACVNAANLLLARATTRSADWLTRLALGATRWRLIRQTLVESVLLALAGSVLGLLLAYWAASFLQNTLSREFPIDHRVVLFTAVAAAATAFIFGFGPALSISRSAIARVPEVGRFLRGPFGSRTRSALVVAQAALCLGLLATSALFTRSLQEMWSDGLPEPSQFLTASFDLDQLRYTPQQADAFYAELLRRLEAIPAVRSAALTDRRVAQVLSGIVSSSGPAVSLPGQSERLKGVSSAYATADFFETMGLTFVEGRTFTRNEDGSPPRVVVVNEEFVKRAFGENPLGRIVTLTTGGAEDRRTVDAMVVGVIANAPGRPIFGNVPHLFFPAPLERRAALDLAVRFDGSAKAVDSALRTIVAGLEPRLPVEQTATGDDLRRQRNSAQYTMTRLVALLGLLSLGLASAGLYGVVSYMVTLRQKEIGIRMALGAASGSVTSLVLRQSIVPVMVGGILGAMGAAIVAKVTRAQLYGVSPLDPIAFGTAALLLLASMMVASLVPARRAARVDPLTVLRTE